MTSAIQLLVGLTVSAPNDAVRIFLADEGA